MPNALANKMAAYLIEANLLFDCRNIDQNIQHEFDKQFGLTNIM